jgi:dTDP-glucose 4,6-dehydratase/UDP-glucuronate decarboxylase
MVDIKDFFPSVAGKVPNIERLEDKKVLVTGASGLIGNHVLSTLDDVGADISITVNSTQPYFFYKGAKYYSWTSLNNSVSRFDYIFHLAGYGQPQRFSSKKFNTIDVNTTRLHDLFFRLEGNGQILFASTSEIYSGLTVEATEDMVGTTTPEHPRAAYIESKRCGEALIHALNELEEGCYGKIARIALAYGPGVRYNDTRVSSDFIRMGLENKYIQPKGGLRNVRTYCYVTNTVEMLFNILLNGKQTVYNVGGESSLTIANLALLIGAKLNAKVELTDLIHTDSSPTFVGISTDKYYDEFDELEWTSIEQGLEQTVAWFQYLRSEK